ncbi:MAG: hypothetical protein Q6365_017520 [Candidatus Sigynarchaeota archaeon]
MELEEPRIIDFKSLFMVPYDSLKKNLKTFFVARLIPDARVVLQEKITRFFTRLAYDESIFLTDAELDGWKQAEGISETDFKETKKMLYNMPSRKSCNNI